METMGLSEGRKVEGLKEDGGRAGGEGGRAKGEGGRGEGEGGRGGKVENGGKFDQGYRQKGGKFEKHQKASQPASPPPVQTETGIEPAVRPTIHQAGIEPATWGSTVPRSTTELLVGWR